MFDEPKARVFILADEQNRVTRVEGEYSLPADLTGWILIDEGYGDRYNLAQSHYLEKPLYTEEGIHRYKYDGGAVVERTQAEIDGDREDAPAPVPSQLDRVEAQAMYTALMTDTLIEEV